MYDNQNNLSVQFLTFIKNKGLRKSDRILLAFSGGVDSVALCLLFVKHGYNVTLAHMNFNLRGEESNEDEEFVRDFAKKKKVNIHIKNVNTSKLVQESNQSTQMIARDIRYTWFDELKKEEGFDYIATAHHKSDSVETVLFNLIKGTGIEGLHGIKFQNRDVIRPLLFASKTELKEFVQFSKEGWREDSSNSINKYARNLIRNKIIPLMSEINPQVEKAIANTSHKLSQIENVFLKKVKGIKKYNWEVTQDEIYINYRQYFNKDDALIILFYQLKEYHFDWVTVVNIYEKHTKAGLTFYNNDNSYVLMTTTDQLILKKVTKNHYSDKLEINNEGSYTIASTSIDVKVVEVVALSGLSENSIYIQEEFFPLILRNVEDGDRIKPFGMKGKSKTVKDLLQDEGVPAYLRDNVFVIQANSGEVLSVVGYRNSEKLRIKKFPAKLFEITLKS
ncbi:tRNA lysidine(34) synthetase TilS [Flammeovirga sp. SubArs3]|uniref:tRNA lysidine(34) synthetase TilS n=1 Tax=Flammeovirga sp. SubArs3 TaxID=2995316 RepID=UPI00248AC70D|nr:tRNA lysidine(34) synthetase TilS [Flammeovirga sp. SubArs3]